MNEKTIALAALIKAQKGSKSGNGKIHIVEMEYVDEGLDDGTSFTGYMSPPRMGTADLLELREKGYTLVAEYYDEDGELLKHDFISEITSNYTFAFYNYVSGTEPVKFEGVNRLPWYEV